MADITRDTFVEANRFVKVIFQRGRNILDSELNEFQDIVRIQVYRALSAGIQKSSTDVFNPGSNDDGYKPVGFGAANQVTIKAGTLFTDGIPVYNATDFTLSGFVTPASDHTETVYMAVSEAEVADPSPVPQLGVTTRRRQIQIALGISVTGDAGVPSDTLAEIWEGGTHYFKLAHVERFTGVDTINVGDVTDIRKLMPPSALASLIVTLMGLGGAAYVGAASQTQAGFPWALSAGSIFSQLTTLLTAVNRKYTVRTISAAGTLAATDSHILLVGSFPFDLQLPNPATVKGQQFYFSADVGINQGGRVTLVRHGSEKIQALAANYRLDIPFASWTVVSDGTDWFIL